MLSLLSAKLCLFLQNSPKALWLGISPTDLDKHPPPLLAVASLMGQCVAVFCVTEAQQHLTKLHPFWNRVCLLSLLMRPRVKREKQNKWEAILDSRSRFKPRRELVKQAVHGEKHLFLRESFQ